MSLHNEYVVDSDRPGSTDHVKGEGWIILGSNLFFDEVNPAAWPADYGPGEFKAIADNQAVLYGLPRYKEWHEVMLRCLTGKGLSWSADVEFWLLDSLPTAAPGLTLADYLAHGQRERLGTIAELGGTLSMRPLCFDGTHWKFLLVRVLNPINFDARYEYVHDYEALTVRVISRNADNERVRVEQDKSQGNVTP